MSAFDTILVPFLPSPDSRESRGLFEWAKKFASWFGSALVLLVPGDDPDLEQAIAGEPAAVGITFRRMTQEPMKEIFEEIETGAPDAILLPFEPGRPEGAPLVSAGTQSVLERSPIPAILVPVRQEPRSERPPFVLVPVSGERRRSEAVETGLKLGNELDVPVDLIHVTPTGGPCLCHTAHLEQARDELHLEYPRLLEDLVAKASPFSSRRERRRVRKFWHCRGDARQEIEAQLSEGTGGLLVLEWGGSLIDGRAETLKGMLRSVGEPVVLTKRSPEASFRLHVGQEF